MQKLRLNSKEIHEIFHMSSSVQHYVINRNNFTYRIILNILEKFIDDKKKVLDIGCGVGTLSFYLANKDKDVLGIDLSQNAITACTETSRLLRFKHIKFQRMNFPYTIPNGKFDLIICIEVLEHINNDMLALKKIYSLLKPNGIVIISVPSKNAPLYRLGFAEDFDRRVGHVRRYILEELLISVKKTGFTILMVQRSEGILRNFLFLNPIAGKFIRFIKFILVDVVSFLDYISFRLFGESQIFIVATRL